MKASYYLKAFYKVNIFICGYSDIETPKNDKQKKVNQFIL